MQYFIFFFLTFATLSVIIILEKQKGKEQMKKYFNKAKANPDIAFICCGFFFDTGKYTVMYSYK